MNAKHTWTLTITSIIQVLLFICKIALVVLLIRPIVLHEINDLLTLIPLCIIIGLLGYSVVVSFIYTVSDMIYLWRLSDSELDKLLNDEYAMENQSELIYLLTHPVQHIEDESIKGNVKGLYIKWDKEKHKMNIACYLYNNKMYPVEELMYADLKEETNNG